MTQDERIKQLEADNAKVLALGERFGFEHKPWTVGQVITHAEYLQQERARLLYLSMTQGQQLQQLEADNARLASEQQHCAKCGGVECHALAGLFCGEHSYEGCREWGGCPICVNARLVGENATVIEARNHLFGRVRALDIETVNQRTHNAQLREQNAALVEAVEAALKYGAFGVREVEVKQQLKSALAASGRGE